MSKCSDDDDVSLLVKQMIVRKWQQGLLALHVSLHARKTLNRKPNEFNVIFLSLDLGKYINISNLILT